MALDNQTFIDLERDADDTGKFVNTKQIITPRYGNPFKSAPLIAAELAENGMFQPFATEVLLKAYIPVVVPTVAKALDSKKVFIWEIRAPKIKAEWYDTGLSEKEQAISAAAIDAKSKADAAQANAISAAAIDAKSKADAAQANAISAAALDATTKADAARDDAIDAAAQAANENPKFKTKVLTEEHLDDVTIDGDYSALNSNALPERGYPLKETCSLNVSAAGTTAKVQTIKFMPSGRTFIRTKGTTTWYDWIEQASITVAKAPIILTNEHLDNLTSTSTYIARTETVATFAKGYPFLAPCVIDVVNNKGDGAVYQTCTTATQLVARRTILNDDPSPAWKIDNIEQGFFQSFGADVVAYDFTSQRFLLPAHANTKLSGVYPVYGKAQLTPKYGNSEVTTQFKDGALALCTTTGAVAGGLRSDGAMLKGRNVTLAFSFMYTDAIVKNLIWQNESGVAGRLQINMNSKYNGRNLTAVPNSFQVFLNGATDGTGVNGNIAAIDVEPNTWYRVILVLSDTPNSSKLYVNGTLVDTFTTTAIADTPTDVMGSVSASTGAFMRKLIVIQDTVLDVAEIDLWLGKSEQKRISEAIKYIALTSTQCAAAAIVPSDGILDDNLVLYEENSSVMAIQASMTKVMTSIVLLDMTPNMDDTIQRTASDSSSGSGSNLSVGDSISVYSALRNLMLPSSNVTANMIARIYGTKKLNAAGNMSPTVDEAIACWALDLNAKAAEIGMTNTVFATPSGLDTETSSPAKTTAMDMLKMMCYATRYTEIERAWSESTYNMPVTNSSGTVRTVTITTTVIPLKDGDAGVLGGKTGTLNRYGYNVGEIGIMPDGRKVAMVTMGAASDADRTTDIRNVMSSMLEKFDWKKRPNLSGYILESV